MPADPLQQLNVTDPTEIFYVKQVPTSTRNNVDNLQR